MKSFSMKSVAALVAASMLATPVMAKQVPGLQDLVGARGAGGESGAREDADVSAHVEHGMPNSELITLIKS